MEEGIQEGTGGGYEMGEGGATKSERVYGPIAAPSAAQLDGWCGLGGREWRWSMRIQQQHKDRRAARHASQQCGTSTVRRVSDVNTTEREPQSMQGRTCERPCARNVRGGEAGSARWLVDAKPWLRCSKTGKALSWRSCVVPKV